MDKIFSDVKERVSMEQVISFLNLTIERKDGAQWRAKCPQCRSYKPTLSMNVEKQLFQCFASARTGKGDQIALTAHIKGITQTEAATLLAEHFPGNSPRHEQSTTIEDLEEMIAELQERVRALEGNKVVKLRVND